MLIAAAPARAQDADPMLQARQHLVPQHFTRDGTFVPQHYEAPKPGPFRGYFADKQAARERQKHRGYVEPAPDYTTQESPDDRRVEGR